MQIHLVKDGEKNVM